jgi:hypothetical protein
MKKKVKEDLELNQNETYEVELPKVFEPESKPEPQHEQEQDNEPTLRKVEVLANLANSIKDKNVQKAMLALPDGKIILSIFKEAVNLKINQVMTGQMEQKIGEGIDSLSDSIGYLSSNINVLQSLAQKTQDFFVHLHKSPLIEVLKTLSENLNKAKENPNPYQQVQPNIIAQPQTPVSNDFESQVEQTPKFTKQRSGSGPGPAPTAPPRGSGDIQFW